MTKNKTTGLQEKILSIPVIAVLVIVFIAVSGVIGFVISMYDTHINAKDERHKAELMKLEAERSKRRTAAYERIGTNKSTRVFQDRVSHFPPELNLCLRTS